MRNVFIVLLLSIFQFGCSAHRIWFGSDLSVITSIKLVKDESGNTRLVSNNLELGEKYTLEGALISWSPEFNAAFLNAEGKGCIQPAAYARLSSASVNLPASAIGSGTGQVDGSYTQLLKELANVTDQSTFLSVGFYGICQLHANGGVANDAVEEMVKELLKQAVAMGNTLAAESNNEAEEQGSSIFSGQ
jgi:hypothetical protein